MTEESSSARETVLLDFLKSLRIALNFISLYSKEHKAFVQAAAELHAGMPLLFSDSPQLRIIFSPEALAIDGNTYQKKQLYLDLARQFHFRKIRSLQINQGVTLQELCLLLEAIVLPLKEIRRRGGIQGILKSGQVSSIVIEELDYSQLLGDEGEVSEDLWSGILRDTIKSEDPSKIKEFTKDFESNIKKVSLKKITADSDLRGSIRDFFLYLKSSDKDACTRCALSLFGLILKDKNPATADALSFLADLLKDLSDEDIVHAVIDEAAHNEEFNHENLENFLKALGSERKNAVNSSLANNIVDSHGAGALSPVARRKLKNLFNVSESRLVSGIYQKVMETLSRDDLHDSRFSFERERYLRNYRYILLFLLGSSDDPELLKDVASRIADAWEAIVQDSRPDYFESLRAIMSKLKDNNSSSAPLEELNKNFCRFVEGHIWQDEIPDWILPYLDSLEEPTIDVQTYIYKIFNQGRINRFILDLYMRFFPQEVDLFCDTLFRFSADIEFVGSIVEEFKNISPDRAGPVLERIYAFSNDLIKTEVLRSMHGWQDLDEGFLLPILQENYVLRKEAMAVLVSSDRTREMAVDLLFANDDIWGRKNALILENISIVEELKIFEARPHLERIAKKPFFWNFAPRRKAARALEAFK
ncbi:MAG: hypothetical protein MUC52_00500 [Candidatus Omnitrophica bacterium]|jgi:hypothetical protein|nr:hypothetical protein [Candidatus Omnitrophota bacterium]